MHIGGTFFLPLHLCGFGFLCLCTRGYFLRYSAATKWKLRCCVWALANKADDDTEARHVGTITVLVRQEARPCVC